MAAITANGRRAFRQGEAIPLQIVCRSATPQAATVNLRLLDGRGAEVQSADVPVTGAAAVAIPEAVTRRLPPGTYTLSPRAEGYASYPLTLDIAADLCRFAHAADPVPRIRLLRRQRGQQLPGHAGAP